MHIFVLQLFDLCYRERSRPTKMAVAKHVGICKWATTWIRNTQSLLRTVNLWQLFSLCAPHRATGIGQTSERLWWICFHLRGEVMLRGVTPHQVLPATTVWWRRRLSFWKQAFARHWSPWSSHTAAEPVESPPQSEFLKHAAQATRLELNTVDAGVIFLLSLFPGTLCKKA